MFPYRRAIYTAEATTLNLEPTAPPRAEAIAPPREVRKVSQRVLLLDDQPDLREVIEDYLTSHSFQITAVNNGAEGLRETIKNPFDLILCDMMMPQLNGEMFYWALTRMRPAAAQRFIFLTGHRNDPISQSFFQRVNAVVLYKPFKLDALLGTIRDVLKKLR